MDGNDKSSNILLQLKNNFLYFEHIIIYMILHVYDLTIDNTALLTNYKKYKIRKNRNNLIVISKPLQH